MYHRTRWTPEKIKQRLELINPLVYIKRKSLPSFNYRELYSAIAPPLIGAEVSDSQWQEVAANEYWGSWMQNFILRTTFTISEGWETNLLEENESTLKAENGSIRLNLGPYQITTIRLKEKA